MVFCSLISHDIHTCMKNTKPVNINISDEAKVLQGSGQPHRLRPQTVPQDSQPGPGEHQIFHPVMTRHRNEFQDLQKREGKLTSDSTTCSKPMQSIE